MRAAAVVRYRGANGLGHVGWAFDATSESVNCGSVENPRGLPSCPVATMGFWSKDVANPVPEFINLAYIDIKFVDLPIGDSTAAFGTIEWISKQPYALLGRNCLDDVYDVLRSFGVPDLPAPSQDLFPDEWFGMWAGSGVSTRLSQYVWPLRPEPPLETMEGLAQRLVHPLGLPSKEPEWRKAGTPEWHELQAQLAASSRRAEIRAVVAR